MKEQSYYYIARCKKLFNLKNQTHTEFVMTHYKKFGCKINPGKLTDEDLYKHFLTNNFTIRFIYDCNICIITAGIPLKTLKNLILDYYDKISFGSSLISLNLIDNNLQTTYIKYASIKELLNAET